MLVDAKGSSDLLPWAQAVAVVIARILSTDLTPMETSVQCDFKRDANLRQVGRRHTYIQTLALLLPLQLPMISEQLHVENLPWLLGLLSPAV